MIEKSKQKSHIQSKRRLINTPWGAVLPKVDLFPIYYLIIIYGFVFFLPFKIYKEYTPYDFWGRGEGLLSELLQFLLYFSSFVLSFLIIWLQRRAIDRKQIISWILLGLFCLFVACEEISLLDHLKGGIESIKQINAQNETNFHNLSVIQPYLHSAFIFSGLFFGWFGWKFFPNIEALPKKRYSLYFLFVSAFYAYSDINSNTKMITCVFENCLFRQEVVEFLMALGLFLHCYKIVCRNISRRKRFKAINNPSKLF